MKRLGWYNGNGLWPRRTVKGSRNVRTCSRVVNLSLKGCMHALMRACVYLNMCVYMGCVSVADESIWATGSSKLL